MITSIYSSLSRENFILKKISIEVISKLFQICSPALDGRGLGGG
jgi:hypothetical protein